MRTIQMTLDEELVSMVDEQVKELGTTRSQFTRDALRLALEQSRQKRLELKHQRGYQKYPVAEKIARRGFYIPSGLALTEENMDLVTEQLKQVL